MIIEGYAHLSNEEQEKQRQCRDSIRNNKERSTFYIERIEHLFNKNVIELRSNLSLREVAFAYSDFPFGGEIVQIGNNRYQITEYTD